MENQEIDKIIEKLQNEIITTQKSSQQACSLDRLKQIAKVYRGEDKIISFAEIADRIRNEKEEVKFMSGYAGLDDLLKGFRPQQLITVSALTASGKCLAKGTEVLMYDGTKKKVEDITVGEYVMGADSYPRLVKALGQGKEEMFKISQRGAEYVVNKSHILSLKECGNSNTSHYNGKVTSKRYTKGKIVNISVEDYFKQSQGFKHRYKGYKTGVYFKDQMVSIDPYFIGLWLGDGTSHTSGVTSADKEVIEYLKEFADKEGMDLRIQKQSNNKSCVYSLTNSWDNFLIERMRFYNLIKNKHIPEDYKINSRTVRLQVLAGLIDSDGSLSKGKSPHIDYITKSKQLADDIYFLASSLGFHCSVNPCKKGIKSIGFIGNYFRIYISGDLSQIPTKIKRKQSKFKSSTAVMSSDIKITPLGVGKYYGFQLSGDGLFVLGNFIVTHNTSFLMDMTTKLKEQNPLWFPFEEGAEELVRKFIERGEEPPRAFTPENMKANTMEWIESKIVEAIAKYDTKIVFIDQLDFIVSMKGENHALNVGQTMRDLKGLSKKWNIVIFIICHLSKARMDTQPTLEDLKGSSSIGQESDTVILLWRESKRQGGELVINNNINVSVQKNRRHGKTGNIKMIYENGKFLEQEWKNEALEKYTNDFYED